MNAYIARRLRGRDGYTHIIKPHSDLGCLQFNTVTIDPNIYCGLSLEEAAKVDEWIGLVAEKLLPGGSIKYATKGPKPKSADPQPTV